MPWLIWLVPLLSSRRIGLDSGLFHMSIVVYIPYWDRFPTEYIGLSSVNIILPVLHIICIFILLLSEREMTKPGKLQGHAL
jgi:high-affinity Fe2+/Pb2+ permease